MCEKTRHIKLYRHLWENGEIWNRGFIRRYQVSYCFISPLFSRFFYFDFRGKLVSVPKEPIYFIILYHTRRGFSIDILQILVGFEEILWKAAVFNWFFAENLKFGIKIAYMMTFLFFYDIIINIVGFFSKNFTVNLTGDKYRDIMVSKKILFITRLIWKLK